MSKEHGHLPIGNYDYASVEPEVIDFWEADTIYDKIKSKNRDKKKFYFLQGPPYTSGKLHIGHAWNNSLKDIVLRYKRMRGFDVWDRGGYDMHGLPTENKVQQILKLQTKKDIENFGVDTFIKECIKFSSETALQANNDLWRLGVWFDHENAYWPIRNSFIEGEWWLIKKADERKKLYKGKKVMTWCASCETGIAKHELEYEEDADDSIFLKFPVVGKDKEFLIIWTTTPWTIPFNLAVMVNPELDYVKSKVFDDADPAGETWILAKALAGALIGSVANKQFEVLEEFTGEKLEGIKYRHPLHDKIPFFEELGKINNKMHTVVLSKEYVDTSAGSGLVHCAPGCGPEDFEVGQENNLPPFNNLNERGFFESMGYYTGWVAKRDDAKFIDELEKTGLLIAKTPVEHEYPHCWRCRNPVVFRATEQWFLRVEELREEMLKGNKDVYWVPQNGKEHYDSWVKNLRDNSITRQRYWGAPVPIWECENNKCPEYIVIGSADELRQKSGQHLPENLHKPWIDEITIKCKCGRTMKRIPDVLDVWIDAGTVSWNCLDWPQNKHLMKEYYPADFILEATEQVRLWFSMLNICSFTALQKQSFKNVYMHGMILDYQGTKMSKSLGNIISPYEVVDKFGADVLRYYMCSVPAGENINFNWEDVKQKQRNLMILWNIHKLLIELARINNINPAKLSSNVLDEMSDEEAYIFSKMNSAITKVTGLYDAYRIDEAQQPVEELFLELSRTYVQLVREKSNSGADGEKAVVIKTLYEVILAVLKMLSTIAPFITEKIYQNLKHEFGLRERSIHLCNWPEANTKQINPELEQDVVIAKDVVQAILNCREQAKLGVRWPLLEAVVVSDDENIRNSVAKMESMIKSQTNVKEVIALDHFKDVREKIALNGSQLGKDFAGNAAKIVAQLSNKKIETVWQRTKEHGRYEIKINGELVSINKEHFVVAKELPEQLVAANIKNIGVYLNKKLNRELEAEGFAREIMRRTQQMRKKSGLQKTNVIELFLYVDAELANQLIKWQLQISQKVGALKLIISADKPDKDYAQSSSEKIRGKTINISFNKLK